MAAGASTIKEPTPRSMAGIGRPRALLLMARPSHLALVLVIFANGALLAMWSGGSTAAAGDVPLGALLLVLVAVAIHLANEAADHETDRLTTRTPFSGGSGALAASGMDPRVPLALALAVAVTGLVGTAAVAASGLMSPTAALLLALGAVAGLAYSLPPLAMARRGWGEPLNAVLGALLLPLYGVATVAGTVGAIDAIAFGPLFFATFASVLATAWPDRRADAATGKRTMQVRLEPATLRRIAVASFIGFLLSTGLAVATDAMPLAILGLLVIPLLVIGLTRYTRVESPLPNVAAMVGLSMITLVGLTVSLIAQPGLV